MPHAPGSRMGCVFRHGASLSEPTQTRAEAGQSSSASIDDCNKQESWLQMLPQRDLFLQRHDSESPARGTDSEKTLGRPVRNSAVSDQALGPQPCQQTILGEHIETLAKWREVAIPAQSGPAMCTAVDFPVDLCDTGPSAAFAKVALFVSSWRGVIRSRDSAFWSILCHQRRFQSTPTLAIITP